MRLTRSRVRPVLAVVLIWMLAHNILYIYIAPFIDAARLDQHVDAVPLMFGITALVGIWIAGQSVDGALRTSVIASLVGFAPGALAFGLKRDSAAIVYGGVGVWGLTFGGAATKLQTALQHLAGQSEHDAATPVGVGHDEAEQIAGAIALGTKHEKRIEASFRCRVIGLLRLPCAAAANGEVPFTASLMATSPPSRRAKCPLWLMVRATDTTIANKTKTSFSGARLRLIGCGSTCIM